MGIHILKVHSAPVDLALAPYRETDAVPDVFKPGLVSSFPLAGQNTPFSSYVHVAGHISSAYCTSAFAQRGEPSLVLVWDSGLLPRLYWVDPASGVENGGELFPLIGHTYATAAHHFGPFRRSDESTTVDDLSVAGKLMAYIALGKPQSDVMDVLRTTFHEHFEAASERTAEFRAEVGGFGSNYEPSLAYLHAYFCDVRRRLPEGEVVEEDVLASVHQFLEDLLIERLVDKVRSWKGDGPWNLCFVGGCALNIKWNSALRSQSMFHDVWVPPFPNDSGSAIGAAALGMISNTGIEASSGTRASARPSRRPGRCRTAGRRPLAPRRTWPGSSTRRGRQSWCSTAGPSWTPAHSAVAASWPRPSPLP